MVVIEDDGDVAGLLPFNVYHDVLKRQRQLLPLGVGTTDYLGGLFAPECSTDEITRAVEWLREQVGNDVFCAIQLPDRSRLLHAFEQRSESRDQRSGVGRGLTNGTASRLHARWAVLQCAVAEPFIRILCTGDVGRFDGCNVLTGDVQQNWEIRQSGIRIICDACSGR